MLSQTRPRQPTWMPIDVGRFSGRWVVLAYRASFLCDPVRPTLRFRWDSGLEETVTLPAPVCGRAIWRGKLPRGAAVSIDPGPGVATERFEVEPLTELAVASVAAKAARAPRIGLMGLVQHASGMRDGGRRKLATILHDEPLRAYDAWKRDRSRPVDFDGLDSAPPNLVSVGRLLVKGMADDVHRWRATIDSLRHQACPNWRLEIEAPDVEAADELRLTLALEFEERVTVLVAGTGGPVPTDLAQLNLRAGDCLAPEAVLVLRYAFHREPEIGSVLFDEDEPFVGKSRVPIFRNPLLMPTDIDICPDSAAAVRLPAGNAARPQRHIARILVHRASHAAESIVVGNVHVLRPARLPSVDIVIPTRDRYAMLQRCLDGVLKRTRYDRLHVLIADNDSVEPAALKLLSAAARDKRVSVLPAPGPFNFAAICNSAVAHGSGEVIVFLNNDVEPVGVDWLDPLVSLAMQPTVGAVGPKLIYPSGSVQHAGIVLGLHGTAGHLYRGAGRHETGYRGRLSGAQAVSAVTGACLAVERSKFERAGGFDAGSFPIEFNDVDLCLRLRELGYNTMWTPASELIHSESASRGRTILPGARRSLVERTRFIARWADAIANDPCFHPVFSLASETPRLA